MITVPLPSLLAVVFIVLKLTHVIAWSWLWVLSPIWIAFVPALVFFAMGRTISR